MPEHKVGTREDWLAARVALLEREKELTRRSDELARQRQELPWVPIEKVYLVLRGTLTLLVEGNEHELVEGELVRVPPSLRRQLVNRSSTAVHRRRDRGCRRARRPRRRGIQRLGRAGGPTAAGGAAPRVPHASS
jgi:Bacterial protein of unknown function (DUF899)/Cupin domain